MMDLSVVIVSCNSRGRLRTCLRSIAYAIREVSVETTVVDNASTDKTAEMVRESFPWVRLVQGSQHAGTAAATNLGLARARGRHLLLLDPDTLVIDGLPDRVVRFLDSAPEAAACGCRLLNPDGTVQPSCRMLGSYSLGSLALDALGVDRLLARRWPAHDRGMFLRFDHDAVREVDFVSGAALAMRRETFETVGYLDEDFMLYGAELDWCHRCRLHGYRVFFFPGAEVIHLDDPLSPSKAETELQLYRGRHRFVAKHFSPGRARASRALMMIKHARALPVALAENLLRRRSPTLHLLQHRWRLLRGLLTTGVDS